MPCTKVRSTWLSTPTEARSQSLFQMTILSWFLLTEAPGIPDIGKAMQEGYSTARPEVRSLGFGAGMGLPNMKRYTDQMEIDTVVGKGTTITMKVAFLKEVRH